MKACPSYLFFLLFCLDATIFAQKADSLSEKSNRYLVTKLDSFQFDRENPLAWVYINAYINNAKRKKDYETLFYGYRTAIYYSNQEKLAYSDSAVVAAKMSKNTNLIGNAHLSRGGAYYIFRNYKKSLDNYLVANDILKNTSDKYLRNRVLYDISVIKIYLGYYDDALALLRDATHYFESKKTSSHTLYYLRSIYRAGEIYQATNNLQKAKETNLLGLQESLKYKEETQEQYFNLAVGVDDYLAGHYADAIRNIEKSLPVLAANGYFEMEEKGNFYIAKSYLGLKQESKALAHFQQVDSLFVQNQYLPNEFRKTYEWLINYYKQEKNKDKQLYYVNQLLKVDEINAGNNKYLAYKINKEYDTQRLLEEKKQLERSFSSWQYYGLGVIFVLLTIGVWLFFRNRKIKLHNKQLKTQYDELLSQNELLKIKNQKETGTKKRLQEIPEDVMQDILNRLEQFEQKNEFLNPKIDQRYLAEKFKTNTTYLSKIINSYKGFSFNAYLNKLRLNYIIGLLKKEPKYREYTIEAIAELCGYTSSRQFSDAFLSETKLRPAYFLEQIQKEEPVPL